MMHPKFILMILLLAASQVLLGQVTQFKVTYVAGKPMWQPDIQGKKTPIRTGQILPARGWVDLPENTRVNLLMNSQLVVLATAGRHDLAKKAAEQSTAGLGFFDRIVNFLSEGLKSVEKEEDLERKHQQYLAISGGVKGFGPGDQGLHLLAPLPGNVTGEEIEFRWAREGHSGLFIISLTDAFTNAEIFKSQVADTFLVVNMGQKGAEIGRMYRWSVELLGAGPGNRGQLDFTYIKPPESGVWETLEQASGYQSADPVSRQWLRAGVWEMEGYPDAARQIYERLLVDEPDNAFLRQSFAVFLVRQDDMIRARSYWTEVQSTDN